MQAVVASKLVKFYGKNKNKVQALFDVSFEVGRGELFGIIGPDGAGKTSLFRILTTLLLPDGGTAMVNELDIVKDFKAIRRIVGYMPGKFSLYQDLSVRENLDFFATIFNTSITENYEMVKEIYLQIEPFQDRKAGKLSGGMKQKLALSCALIHRPAILFLDEPTTGVDAVSRKEFWDMLKNLQKQGITIIVSTPYMDEASLCDRVALMQSGKILKINTPSGIREQFGKPLYAVRGNRMFPILNALKNYEAVEDVYPFGDRHHVIMKDVTHGENELRAFLEPFSNDHLLITSEQPDIEDCFMALMKNQHE